MSLLSRRLLATIAAIPALLALSAGVVAANLPPSTWVALSPLPGAAGQPVFALAVDPNNDMDLIGGNSAGGVYRSQDGGQTWSRVFASDSRILTVAFSPFRPGTVLAGTQGGGGLLSVDGGANWISTPGLEGRAVRAFGFARTLVAAGTDRGVYTSSDGSAWTQSGLASLSVDSLAVAAVNPPVRLIAGGDSGTVSALPLYQSGDGGATWDPMNPAVSGTIVTRVATGPLPASGDVRPLLLGTNDGLFISSDGGAHFTALSGGPLLPSTDYSQAVFTASHFDRFFVASDGGGGGEAGGLWATADSGTHFSSLVPPLPSITALAVSADEQPILYVATFRASDHSAALWAFHDTGGTPQGAGQGSTPVATSPRTGTSPGSGFDLGRFLSSTEAPYVGIGAAAVLLLLIAAGSHFRSRRS